LTGPSDWKNVSLLMTKKYGIKNKSSKQCRERWVNSLCPNINKGIWTEKEEKILFLTQLKIGNKWSELAKFLPGRSENDIKNHFYSKLRKYIRKICKELHKSKLLESKGINSSLYTSNKVYSLIQIENIPLISLSKNTIVNAIQKDYLSKEERLNKLKESSINDTIFDLSTDIENSIYTKVKENKNFILLKNINSANDFIINEFSKINNDKENECNNLSYVNKKRNGINIFEELLKDDY
jgi:hypothetical protein